MPDLTLYLRSDTHTVNGLTAYKLGTSPGVSEMSFSASYPSGPEYYGVARNELYVRSPSGTEVQLGSVTTGVWVTQQNPSYSFTLTSGFSSWQGPASSCLVLRRAVAIVNLPEWRTWRTFASPPFASLLGVGEGETVSFSFSSLAARGYFAWSSDPKYPETTIYSFHGAASDALVFSAQSLGTLHSENRDASCYYGTRFSSGATNSAYLHSILVGVVHAAQDGEIYNTVRVVNETSSPVTVYATVPFGNLWDDLRYRGVEFWQRHGVAVGRVAANTTADITDDRHLTRLLIKNKWWSYDDTGTAYVAIADDGTPSNVVTVRSPFFTRQGFHPIRPVTYFERSDAYRFDTLLHGCTEVWRHEDIEFTETADGRPKLIQYGGPETVMYVPSAGHIYGLLGLDETVPSSPAFSVGYSRSYTGSSLTTDIGFFQWESNHNYTRADQAVSPTTSCSIDIRVESGIAKVYKNGSVVMSRTCFGTMGWVPFNISGWGVHNNGHWASYEFQSGWIGGTPKAHFLFGDWWSFLCTYETDKFDVVPLAEQSHPSAIKLKNGVSSGVAYTTCVWYKREYPQSISIYLLDYTSSSPVRVQYVNPDWSLIPDSLITGNSQGFDIYPTSNTLTHEIPWTAVYAGPVGVKITLFSPDNLLSFVILNPAQTYTERDEDALAASFFSTTVVDVQASSAIAATGSVGADASAALTAHSQHDADASAAFAKGASSSADASSAYAATAQSAVQTGAEFAARPSSTAPASSALAGQGSAAATAAARASAQAAVGAEAAAAYDVSETAASAPVGARLAGHAQAQTQSGAALAGQGQAQASAQAAFAPTALHSSQASAALGGALSKDARAAAAFEVPQAVTRLIDVALCARDPYEVMVTVEEVYEVDAKPFGVA